MAGEGAHRRWWLPIALPLAALGLVSLVIIGLAGSLEAQAAGACQTPIAAGSVGPVGGVPPGLVGLFQGAAARFSLGDQGPSILAAINYFESDFDRSTLPGVHSGANPAGAAGPMQIGIGSAAGDAWDAVKVYGVPGGAVPPSVYDEPDAVYAAANYLQRDGAPGDWRGAVFAYNHAVWYVNKVLAQAETYYEQGLGATATIGPASSSGPVAVPPAAGDPAGPLTLVQGQPAFVAAEVFSSRMGAWGDDLGQNPDAFSELSPGPVSHPASAQAADMLGALPYDTALEVTNPANGRSMTVYKRDYGPGSSLSSTLRGYHYRIAILQTAANELGLTGPALVQVTLVGTPQNAPAAGGCPAGTQSAPGGYADPFAHTIDLVPQRIDMGVDYDGVGEIDALGDAQITFARTRIGGNWTCSTPENGGIVYQLLDGPDEGRYVYVTEDVIPTATSGQTIKAGEQVGTFAPPSGSGCIETGWSESGGYPSPAALADGGYTDGDRTAAGQNFSDLLAALGAPAGLVGGRPLTGHYP
jgi:hypothetical protein